MISALLSGLLASAPMTAPTAADPTPDPAALVKQLGSDDFAEREAAEKQLKQLGAKAEPALKAGLKSEVPEVRTRAARVLMAVRKESLDVLVKTFDPAADKQPDHPIWNRFKGIVGNDLPARKLFTEIIADPRRLKLLDDADRDPDKVGDLYAAEVMNLYRGRIPRKGRPWCDAVVIYLGTYPATGGRLQDQTRGEKAGEREMMTEYLHCVSMVATVENLGPNDRVSDKTVDLARALKPMAPALKRLLAAWYPYRDADLASSGLRIAVYQEIEELLPFARRVAADPKRPAAMRCDALAALVKFGTPKDLPLFEGLFADETVLFDGDPVKHGYPPSVEPGQTQARDCAVGMALLLHNRDPFEFGFRAAKNNFERENGRPVVTRYHQIHGATPYLGFADDKSRLAAHKKAKEWLEKQK